MAYAKSEETRQKLVKTTSKLLRTQGYASTGVSQILRESGVPKGSLYHHFPEGKTELAAAAVKYSNDFIRERLQEMVSVTDDPADTVAHFCNFYVHSLHKTDYHKGCPISTITLEAAASVDAIQVECAEGFNMIVDLFVEQMTLRGVATSTAKSLATVVTAAVEGALILCRAQRSTRPLEIVRDSMSAQIRSQLALA